MKNKTKVIVASMLVLAITVTYFTRKDLLPQAGQEEKPTLEVEMKAKDHYLIQYTAPAGKTIIYLHPEGNDLHYMSAKTGKSQTYRNRKLVSIKNTAAFREGNDLVNAYLDYADMAKLDRYVHQLFSTEATLDNLPKGLRDDYRIRQEDSRYVIERTAKDKVISSGPSRYVYHYDAPLTEQFGKPSYVEAFRDDNQIVIEFKASSGTFEIEVKGDTLHLRYKHKLLEEVTEVDVRIADNTEDSEAWLPAELMRTEEEEAQIDDYLAALPQDVRSLPILPNELRHKYVVHYVDGTGIVVEHLIG